MGLSFSRPKDNEKETIHLQNTDTIIHGNGHTKIDVLVVCSLKPHKRRMTTDYGESHEFIFSHFYPEDNKTINVQFIETGDLKTQFPHDVMDQIYNDSFNMIWFAGCNCLQWIFYYPVESIKIAYKILKDDGIIIFTEGDHYKKQRTKIKNINNPTMKIQNMKQSFPEEDQIKKANVISIFKQYFEENIDYIKENPTGGETKSPIPNPYCLTFFRPFCTPSINNDPNDHQDAIISYKKKRFYSDSSILSNQIIQQVQRIQNNHRNATHQGIG
jgi:SAM-dependent methyltransferase